LLVGGHLQFFAKLFALAAKWADKRQAEYQLKVKLNRLGALLWVGCRLVLAHILMTFNAAQHRIYLHFLMQMAYLQQKTQQ
jgi:hypothetical protein